MTDKSYTVFNENRLPFGSHAIPRSDDLHASKPVLERSQDETVHLGQFSRFAQTNLRGFDLGPFGLILQSSKIYEIIESTKISPIPGSDALFKGLVNHRSNIVPIYDINQLLADQNKKTWERKRLLILGSGADIVGIILYHLPIQIKSDQRIHAQEIKKLPEIFQRHTENAYINDGKLWLELNYQAFFKELSDITVQSNEQTF